MKKVLYLGGFELPDKNAAAQRVISNAKLLRDIGYEVILIGLTRNQRDVGKIFEFESFRCLNLSYPINIRQWFQYLFSITWYKRYIKDEKPDVIIAYNHPAIALKKLLMFDKKHGIKTLSDCTEWYEPDGGILFRAIKGLDINQRMYKVHPKLDGMIVISKYLDNFYRKVGVKTLLLPPLVDIEDAKWKGQPESNNDKINLVFAGSIGRNKDRLDMIIQALSVVRSHSSIDLNFNIIGITESQYCQAYHTISKKPLPSFVKFLGRISHKDVITQLLKSDFQIFLRENNLANTAGFPTKFVESISAGIMVITNYSSDLSDYLKDGVNGYLIDISDEESLVKTLAVPLSLSKSEIKNKKDQVVRNTFDYRSYIEVTRTFINSIL